MAEEILYDKLTRYCSYQERCVSDVYQKLIRMKVARSEFQAYIERLKQENYLNEERYVQAFLSGHLRKNWGKPRIKQMLLLKGISEAIIQKHLLLVEHEEYEERLHQLAQRKLKIIKAENVMEQKIKLSRYLIGKGFEREKIQAVVKQLFQ